MEETKFGSSETSDLSVFDDHDWAHLHDCILNATWNGSKKKCIREELIEIYHQLPEDLKQIAQDWGMNDTPFRDGVFEWYQEKFGI